MVLLIGFLFTFSLALLDCGKLGTNTRFCFVHLAVEKSHISIGTWCKMTTPLFLNPLQLFKPFLSATLYFFSPLILASFDGERICQKVNAMGGKGKQIFAAAPCCITQCISPPFFSPLLLRCNLIDRERGILFADFRLVGGKKLKCQLHYFRTFHFKSSLIYLLQ